jgi:hypothetical protein
MVVANKVLFLDAESARRFPDNQIVICFFFFHLFIFLSFCSGKKKIFSKGGEMPC